MSPPRVHRQMRAGDWLLAACALSLALACSKLAPAPPDRLRPPSSMPGETSYMTELLAPEPAELPAGQASAPYSSIFVAGREVDPWTHVDLAVRAGPDGTASLELTRALRTPYATPGGAPSTPNPIAPALHAPSQSTPPKIDSGFWIATALPHDRIHWDGRLLTLRGLPPGALLSIGAELWRRSPGGSLSRSPDNVGDCRDQCVLALGDPTAARETPGPALAAALDAAARVPFGLPVVLWGVFILWRRFAHAKLRKLSVALGLRPPSPLPVRQPPVG